MTPARLQEIAFAQMQDFGLDLDVFKTTWDFKHPNGVTSETRSYPSQTIPGLVFTRDLRRYTEDEDPIEVSWTVVDKATRVTILGGLKHMLSQVINRSALGKSR